jgi:hypothetical protein
VSNSANDIRITVSTAGWEEIKKILDSQVEAAKLTALINDDEAKMVELWRRAQVASQLVNGLYERINSILDE